MDPAAYYKALTNEILAVKDRVATLIDESHQGEIGSWRESIIRSLLRRHLPSTIGVGQGFILTDDGPTTQLDIIVYDLSFPKLVQEGELVIVTPDAVRAIVEVKSTVRSLKQDLQKLSTVALKCRSNPDIRLVQRRQGGRGVFIGYLAFALPTDRVLSPQHINNAFRESVTKIPMPLRIATEEYTLDQLHQIRILEQQRSRILLQPELAVINAVCLGPDRFVRYWTEGEELSHSSDPKKWKIYDMEGLSFGYFITNLLAAVSPESIDLNHDRWWPSRGKGEGRSVSFPRPEEFSSEWTANRLRHQGAVEVP